jgi:hypothetical protein
LTPGTQVDVDALALPLVRALFAARECADLHRDCIASEHDARVCDVFLALRPILSAAEEKHAAEIQALRALLEAWGKRG